MIRNVVLAMLCTLPLWVEGTDLIQVGVPTRSVAMRNMYKGCSFHGNESIGAICVAHVCQDLAALNTETPSCCKSEMEVAADTMRCMGELLMSNSSSMAHKLAFTNRAWADCTTHHGARDCAMLSIMADLHLSLSGQLLNTTQELRAELRNQSNRADGLDSLVSQLRDKLNASEHTQSDATKLLQLKLLNQGTEMERLRNEFDQYKNKSYLQEAIELIAFCWNKFQSLPWKGQIVIVIVAAIIVTSTFDRCWSTLSVFGRFISRCYFVLLAIWKLILLLAGCVRKCKSRDPVVVVQSSVCKEEEEPAVETPAPRVRRYRTRAQLEQLRRQEN